MRSQEMAHHAHVLLATSATVHTGFVDRSLEPVLTVDSGDVVSIETLMLLGGELAPGQTIDDITRLRQRYRAGGRSSHTLTGPICVRDAEPGDVLEVRILRLLPHPFGVNYCMPGASDTGTLPDEFPEGHVRDFRWEPGAGEADFGPGIRLPLRPFLGVMAVAPSEPGEVSAVRPGPYGGNLDLKELVEGTTLYLPVFVPGALFSTGDAHAVQGDGEVNGTAIETAMSEARLQFIVRKDMKLERPMAETPTHWITMGFHEDLDEAARIALRDAIDWLVRQRGLTREDAYSLCSLAVDLRITQLVDQDKGVHAMIPRAIWDRAPSARESRDARQPEETDRSQLQDAMLEDAASFHGELCVGVAMGVRAMHHAMVQWQMVPKDPKLVVHMGEGGCMADALQALTGATLGNGRMKVPGGRAFRLSYGTEKMLAFQPRELPAEFGVEDVLKAGIDDLFVLRGESYGDGSGPHGGRPTKRPPPEEKQALLLERVVRAAVDGRLSCAAAHRLARELGVGVPDVGWAADAAKLRIAQCQLGCFK